jgi:cysteine synthase
MPTELFANAVEAMRGPRVVALDEGLFAAAFQLMKLLPADFILEQAAADGLLEPGTTVVETTSGTFGLGLAMSCRARGLPLHVVSDPVIDPPLRMRLETLGARIEIVTEPAEVGGIQQARLDRVAELSDSYDAAFVPQQYDNPHSPTSYGVAAERIAESAGVVDCLVGTVGSGGSMCGIGSYLRALFPEMAMIGVDTPGSVLFGGLDGPRTLRGLGSSIHPANLDPSQFDEVHWVTAAEAFGMTRALYREHCLFMGPTSGAAYLVAAWWARRNPGARVVAVMPDEGYRYQSTVYDPAWLAEQGLALDARPEEPELIDHPHRLGERWSRLAWGRRSLDEVL